MEKSKNYCKNIGIITIHDADNFGSVFQAFATQWIFSSYAGYKSKIIDYKCPKIQQEYGVRLIGTKKNVFEIVKSVILVLMQYRSASKFKRFKRNNYAMTHFGEDLEKQFDIFIVGSDQVWNYEITGYDANFYLEFVNDNTKKYSFASSFGIEYIPDDLKEVLKKYLENFKLISVRDSNSQKIVKSLTGIEASIVLDPTLLLNKEEWMKVANTSLKIKDKYILVYQIAHSRELASFAEKLSEATGYKIISVKGSLRQRFNAKYLWDVGPAEFLVLLSEARYVVTNSFHGTAFSINFNKDFFVGTLPPPAKVNSRIFNILESFQLENRMIDNAKSITDYSKIDYDSINQTLLKKKAETRMYIRKILDDRK